MIFLIKLSDIENNYNDLLKLVGKKRKEQIEKDKAKASKLYHLASGLLYRIALGNNYEECMAVNEHGKPYALNNTHFNVSHSGDYAALYIGDNECGIDIEKINKKRISLSSKVFSDDELSWINNDTKRFFQAWTRKESVSKTLGMGFFYPYKRINVLNDCFVFDESKKIFTCTTCYDNHIISVSEENKYPDMAIKILDIESIKDETNIQ